MGAGSSSTKKRVAPSESLHDVGAGCGGGEVGIRHLKMNHAMVIRPTFFDPYPEVGSEAK